MLTFKLRSPYAGFGSVVGQVSRITNTHHHQSGLLWARTYADEAIRVDRRPFALNRVCRVHISEFTRDKKDNEPLPLLLGDSKDMDGMGGIFEDIIIFWLLASDHFFRLFADLYHGLAKSIKFF